MSKKIYISYTDIQNFLNDYFAQNKNTASMFDAVFNLYNYHQYTYQPRELDLPESKLTNVQKLYQKLGQLSIEVTPIIKGIQGKQLHTTISETTFFPKTKDATILLQFQNEKSQMHHHDYFEMNLVLQGQMQATYSNEKMMLKTGDFIIISPYTRHQLHIFEDSNVVCITIRKSTFDDAFFNLLKNDDLISTFFKRNLYSSEQNFLLFSVPINYQLLETIQNIFITAYSTASQANTICCAYISILLSYALQGLTNPETFTSHKKNLTNKMATIINLIEEQANTITLDALAQKFNYDKAYLGKLIFKSSGYSFNYLRNYYRIKKSCQLLQFTDHSIAEISNLTGYSSPNHFERCFHQIIKISPSQYRKNNR